MKELLTKTFEAFSDHFEPMPREERAELYSDLNEPALFQKTFDYILVHISNLTVHELVDEYFSPDSKEIKNVIRWIQELVALLTREGKIAVLTSDIETKSGEMLSGSSAQDFKKLFRTYAHRPGSERDIE